MKRVIVTGANGFVGRRLCQTLSERGYQVLAVVRDVKPEHPILSASQIIPMGNLGPDTVWDSALLTGVDAIFHLAARVHVFKGTAIDQTAEFDRVNVGATMTLARAASGIVKRFVFVSSLHAMCTLSDGKLTEESPCLPDGPYGRSKLKAEAAVKSIGNAGGMETTIIRPPAVYGPGHLGRLMRLFELVHRGVPLPVRGLDNQRSLIYVDNLVDCLIECAFHPAANGQTFLVSDGTAVSLPELVERMSRAVGRKIWMLPAPIRLMRTAASIIGKRESVERLFGSLAVDSQLIQTQLGWQPPYGMDEGLQTTAMWMKGAA